MLYNGYGDFMNIINVKEHENYLKEYIKLCSKEWGKPKTKEEMNEYIDVKYNDILNGDKVISIIGLEENNKLIGFISLFKYDGDERQDLTPWYATMYVNEDKRGKGYSKLLNELILKETKELGYNKIYLKSDLINFYEKFGAKYIETLNNGEKLFYIDLN